MSKKYNLDIESQIKNNPAFCTMPFTHQYIATDGFVNLCCLADYNKPIVKHVQGHDLQKVWTGNTMQDIRKKMLKGEFEPRCKTCWKQDKEGGGSDRESLNAVYLKHKLKENPITLDIEKGNSTGGPTWADLRPGRLCNFGCRMCFGAISSTIAQEQLEHPETQDIMFEEWKDVKDWIDDPVCFESIKKQIPKMNLIKLAGGEPLFMPGVYKLLKWCIDSGNTHLMLDVTTNGSRIKGKTTNLLPKFAKVDLQFSMCGVGVANDYIRYGANWDQLDKAYKHYLKLPGLRVQLLATAQIYNAWDLANLIDYWYETGASANIVFNPVNGPIDLMIDLLPYTYRIEIAEDLKKRLCLLTQEQQRISRIHHIITRLTKPEPTDLETIDKYKNWRTHFVKRTLLYDRIRKQDVTKIHPKLTEVWNTWLKEYGD